MQKGRERLISPTRVFVRFYVLTQRCINTMFYPGVSEDLSQHHPQCTLQPSLPRTFSMFTIHYSTFHSIKYNPMVWENDCIVLYSSGASERPLKKKTSHILRFIVPDQMMWKSQAVRRFFLSCLPSGLEKKTRWRGISSVISQHCTKKPHDSLVKLLDNRHQTPGVDGDNDRS